MRPGQLAIRTRLTMLYGAAFLAAGAILVTVMYLLVRKQLAPHPPLGLTGGVDVPAGVSAPVPSDRDFVVTDGTVQRFLNDTLSTLLWQSVLVLLLAAVLAVALGWVVAGRALKPLHQVTETARRVDSRGLHERIAMVGPRDEIKELADTFDAMLDHLDKAFEGQRRFVSNASHELRTPLAVARTLVEVAAAAPDASEDLRRLAPTLLACNEQSEQLIDCLLVLASSEQQIIDRQPVDLAEIATAAAARVQPEASERAITVQLDLAPADVSGEPVLLERMAVNLMENAVRYNVEDGRVAVSTAVEGGRAVLRVTNTGPEVLAYDIPGLFEPFRRGAGRVGTPRGTGLGLSIVRAVARAHNGAVEAAPNGGGGLAVRVSLALSGATD